MCGIFGFSLGKNLSVQEISSVKSDIKNFVDLSITRGSDTFGININFDKINYIFKSNSNPKTVIKKREYNEFINEKLKLASDQKPFFNYFGQTRLVTNGTKFFYKNNQPISLKRITGLHNGIFLFSDEEKLNQNKKNYESFQMKSDSLTFFEKLEKKAEETDESIIKCFIEFVKEIDGNFSIALTDLKEQVLLISSNCGSLYYSHDIENKIFAYASEKNILKKFIKDSKFLTHNKVEIKKVINQSVALNYLTHEIEVFDNLNFNKKINITTNQNKLYDIITNEQEDLKRLNSLKKCTKCVLPETYPFIDFDNEGVCNYCNSYQKQNFLGEEKLEEFLAVHRKNNNTPDCLIGLSGGRDSCYGLHILKKRYKMNPIAFTYDWGLTTDTSRLNASILCGKLGVEHLIRSADIEKKRNYVRQNIFAWLKDPHLGMLPIIQAGDKGFMDLGRTLCKELNVNFSVQATGYQLEQREFFLGFTGIKQKLRDNQRMSSYAFVTKLKMFLWYSYRTLKNPAYINAALLDNFNGYLSSFIKKENALHLFKYIKWNEKEMVETLENEYGWISDKSYGKNQWRMGDGQTAFNNFIYYHMAGFSEFDNFRSNQIREGLIDRNEALKLCVQDNSIKFKTLKNFSEIIGFNLDEVLTKIICIPKLY
jgi:glucosamine--fructose-6-phosphate aminotransferase (isomerizing)